MPCNTLSESSPFHFSPFVGSWIKLIFHLLSIGIMLLRLLAQLCSMKEATKRWPLCLPVLAPDNESTTATLPSHNWAWSVLCWYSSLASAVNYCHGSILSTLSCSLHSLAAHWVQYQHPQSQQLMFQHLVKLKKKAKNVSWRQGIYCTGNM